MIVPQHATDVLEIFIRIPAAAHAFDIEFKCFIRKTFVIKDRHRISFGINLAKVLRFLQGLMIGKLTPLISQYSFPLLQIFHTPHLPRRYDPPRREQQQEMYNPQVNRLSLQVPDR